MNLNAAEAAWGPGLARHPVREDASPGAWRSTRLAQALFVQIGRDNWARARGVGACAAAMLAVGRWPPLLA